MRFDFLEKKWLLKSCFTHLWLGKRRRCCCSRADRAVPTQLHQPSTVPCTYMHVVPSVLTGQRPQCLRPQGCWLRGSILALSDVRYALWNPGHHAVQRLGQTDLATQSRSEGKNENHWLLFEEDNRLFSWWMQQLIAFLSVCCFMQFCVFIPGNYAIESNE